VLFGIASKFYFFFTFLGGDGGAISIVETLLSGLSLPERSTAVRTNVKLPEKRFATVTEKSMELLGWEITPTSVLPESVRYSRYSFMSDSTLGIHEARRLTVPPHDVPHEIANPKRTNVIRFMANNSFPFLIRWI
jgi:hypothetical protein